MSDRVANRTRTCAYNPGRSSVKASTQAEVRMLQVDDVKSWLSQLTVFALTLFAACSVFPGLYPPRARSCRPLFETGNPSGACRALAA
jgi:hypothetical protein